jgi:hypothetical protein
VRARRPPDPRAPRRPASAQELADLEGLAWLLDRAVPIPGTRRRFGIDGVVGLVPVAGDVFTGSVGAYLIIRALQYRVPPVVIARMVFNTVVDLVLGLVPLLGDLFDFVFQSNSRNLALLRLYAQEPTRSTRQHRLFFLGVLLVVVGILALVVAVLGQLLALLSDALRGA